MAFGFGLRRPIWAAMVSSLTDIRSNRRIMAYTAAAIYGIAGLDGAVEGLLPSDPPFALLPVIVVFVMFALLMAVGVRAGAPPVRRADRRQVLDPSGRHLGRPGTRPAAGRAPYARTARTADRYGARRRPRT